MLPLKFDSPYENIGGWKNSMKKRLGMLYLPKHTLYESSVYMYEACTDHMPVETFFTEFKMRDTYYSWFLITELHVWLLMARSMSEGPEGKFLRNQLVTRLWEDSASRLKQLAKMGTKDKNETMNALHEHFQAGILSYDEGLLDSDKALAGAIWRMFFTYECEDFTMIEKLVAYVRAQHEHLLALDTEAILIKGVEFKWKPFPPFHVKKSKTIYPGLK
ncbi:Ubiquinol-cytochrome-c reductase complex assembly factor 1 [Halotydeus destructor]|nr:Ubiquinol-cytochrome-c reductase complex assembly factor 1 [Halotydeus destructor]